MNNKKEINVVWLKRDLRSQDHLPLFEAEQQALPYLILYVFEPSLMAQPDCSLRHLQFQYHSLMALKEQLQPFQASVHVFCAELLPIFEALQEKYSVKNIFSYQESGTALSYARDKALKAYCKSQQISWREYQRDGIQRGIKNREHWDKSWYATMHSPCVKNSYTVNKSIAVELDFPLPAALQQQLAVYPVEFQPAGEINARKYLHSFVKERGKNYSKHISKPTESRKSCSRLSPYLSWGNLSVKQAYQYIYGASKVVPHGAPLKNALTRLKWHCHFIQKFEVDCSYETQCINKGYELLAHPKNEAFIWAWKSGQTGYPLVDACMRCLIQTGWLNFRMRAMLVSFFCHLLDQDWREGSYHLAQLFLDYEPGIHYPQFQMQAGTTGINTIRMYNPIKQAKEHDPEGVFIRRWLPELQNVATKYIHEPYTMPLLEQQFCGLMLGEQYPFPVVDFAAAAKNAREKIWGHRKNELVRTENVKIIQTHTRNRKLADKKQTVKSNKEAKTKTKTSQPKS